MSQGRRWSTLDVSTARLHTELVDQHINRSSWRVATDTPRQHFDTSSVALRDYIGKLSRKSLTSIFEEDQMGSAARVPARRMGLRLMIQAIQRRGQMGLRMGLLWDRAV